VVLRRQSPGCQIDQVRIIQAAMTSNHLRLIALLSAIAASAALRLVPHPPDFTPIGAMALFSGAYLRKRGLAFAAPLGGLLLSDLVLGFYPGMWVQYFAVALIVLIAWAALKRVSVARVGGAALASSALFFLLTNFGTWALSGMYPLSAAGLAACYVAAIPFFQNTVAGDLFYATLLFGGFALLERAVPALRGARQTQPA
jgi:uncharacterized protein DUF6580